MTSWPGYERLSDRSRKDKWGKAFTAEWMCEAHGPSVFKAILTGDPYQVRALFVSGSNPLYVLRRCEDGASRLCKQVRVPGRRSSTG